MDAEFQKLTAHETQILFEYRSTKPCINHMSGKSVPETEWLFYMATIQLYDFGELKSITGYPADIIF